MRTGEAPREYLSVAETASLLGLCEKKVRQLLKAGIVPAAKLGRQYIIPRAKLEAVIEQMIASNTRSSR